MPEAPQRLPQEPELTPLGNDMYAGRTIDPNATPIQWTAESHPIDHPGVDLGRTALLGRQVAMVVNGKNVLLHERGTTPDNRVIYQDIAKTQQLAANVNASAFPTIMEGGNAMYHEPAGISGVADFKPFLPAAPELPSAPRGNQVEQPPVVTHWSEQVDEGPVDDEVLPEAWVKGVRPDAARTRQSQPATETAATEAQSAAARADVSEPESSLMIPAVQNLSGVKALGDAPSKPGDMSMYRRLPGAAGAAQAIQAGEITSQEDTGAQTEAEAAPERPTPPKGWNVARPGHLRPTVEE